MLHQEHETTNLLMHNTSIASGNTCPNYIRAVFILSATRILNVGKTCVWDNFKTFQVSSDHKLSKIEYILIIF